jgi:hypothetical protein
MLIWHVLVQKQLKNLNAPEVVMMIAGKTEKMPESLMKSTSCYHRRSQATKMRPSTEDHCRDPAIASIPFLQTPGDHCGSARAENFIGHVNCKREFDGGGIVCHRKKRLR